MDMKCVDRQQCDTEQPADTTERVCVTIMWWCWRLELVVDLDTVRLKCKHRFVFSVELVMRHRATDAACVSLCVRADTNSVGRGM